MRRALLVASLLAALVLSGEAAAEEVVLSDDEGRSITFDVRADGADVDWFAGLLRAAPHADEISSVRVVLVGAAGLRRECGHEARGCYENGTITVASAKTDVNAHTLLHEYGHHVDASRGVSGIPEPNGSSTWWRARGMERLVQLRTVYRGYTRGWERSIAEIFAEDYAQLARPGSPFRIRWLEGPTAVVREAILHDLGLGPKPAAARPPGLKPVTFGRRGTLAPQRAAAVPFGLLGPGRRVRATVTVAGETARGVRARLELRCDGRRVSTRTLARGTRVVSIDRPSLGPAERCTVSVTNTSGTARHFDLTVRLTVAL